MDKTIIRDLEQIGKKVKVKTHKITNVKMSVCQNVNNSSIVLDVLSY